MPLWYLLVPYCLFLFVATVFLFFNIFHIVKFGLQETKTTLVLLAYIFLFLGTITLTLIILSFFDWNFIIEFSNFLPSAKSIDIL